MFTCPFFHCFGSVLGAFAALSHGSCIVLPSESFDPKICMEVIQKYKCTALYGVPMMFISILSLPNLLNYDYKTKTFYKSKKGYGSEWIF